MESIFQIIAHPIKFAPTMAKALGEELSMHEFAADLMNSEKEAKKIGKSYMEFVACLMN